MNVFDAEMGGYAELRGTYNIGVDGTPWALVERVRPTFEIKPTERISATAVVEAHLSQGRDQVQEVTDILQGSDAAPYLTNYCIYTPDDRNDVVSEYFSVERLYVDFDTRAVDVRVGRQAFNWGSALFFHPTDLYNELLITEPWRERKGVNAVRATVPIGPHQVQAVVAADDDLSVFWSGDTDITFDDLPFSGALKATLHTDATDWSLVGYGRTSGEWFGGVDLRGTLGVGWWVEGGWHGEENVDELAMEVSEQGGFTGGVGAPEVVAGIDYSFPVWQMFYVAAEYRYDGSGTDPDHYDYSGRTTGLQLPYDCNFFPQSTETRTTVGIHYVDATVRVQPTTDLSITASGLVNLLDGTGMAIPDVAYNIGGRVQVHLGAQIPFGQDGEFRPAEEDLVVKTDQFTIDFSGLLYDATVQAWARYSF